MSPIVSIISLYILLSDARKLDDGMRQIYWNEIEENGEAKKIREYNPYKPVEFLTRSIGFDDDQALITPAQLARCVLNQADWATIATIWKDSSLPIATLVAIADGPFKNGTGIPYLYLSLREFSVQKLAENHRATLLVSLAENNYCRDNEYDASDPRCSRVLLTGKIKPLKDKTKEYKVVKKFFFSRHPKLDMAESNDYFFAEFKISAIDLLDNFNGPQHIDIQDYFKPVPFKFLSHHEKIAVSFIFEPTDG